MSGLVLKLAPHERVLINGAVVENGDRRSRLTVLTAESNILRLRDAIHPDKAVTPVGRLCYALQLILVGEAGAEAERPKALRGIEDLSRVFTDADSRALLEGATQALIDGNVYRCLKTLRALLPREARLLALAGA